MIYFAPFTTSRIKATMREISIGDAMAYLLMPEQKAHEGITYFLRAVCSEENGIDPELWTLQERTLAVCHYYMGINPEQPDFAVGDGKFSDYAQLTMDIPKGSAQQPLSLGEIEGDHWAMHHLYGYMLQAVERVALAQSVNVPDGNMRLLWLFGCMAAQLVREGEEVPDWRNSGAYDDWLSERTTKLLSYPESAISSLLAVVLHGKNQLHHFFDYNYADADKTNAQMGGIVFLPKEAAVDLPPAMFLPAGCISNIAYSILGKLPPDSV